MVSLMRPPPAWRRPTCTCGPTCVIAAVESNSGLHAARCCRQGQGREGQGARPAGARQRPGPPARGGGGRAAGRARLGGEKGADARGGGHMAGARAGAPRSRGCKGRGCEVGWGPRHRARGPPSRVTLLWVSRVPGGSALRGRRRQRRAGGGRGASQPLAAPPAPRVVPLPPTRAARGPCQQRTCLEAKRAESGGPGPEGVQNRAQGRRLGCRAAMGAGRRARLMNARGQVRVYFCIPLSKGANRALSP